jgi:predicted N-acetyltransferase YhbS|tara:strand:+ start:558 stop:1001 length:444 start_codon:yes stop_codon:yes gene_type:complete
MVKLRKACEDDTYQIRELLKNWLVETKLDFGKTNNSKARENILEYIDKHFVIVAEDDNKIIGSIAMANCDTWYTDKAFYRTLWFFVDQEKRNPQIAKSLLDFAREYAKIRNIPMILEIMQGKDMERKHQWATRQHLNYLGGTYSEGL